MRIRYSSRAQRDLEEICSYIERENPRAAARVRREIVATILLLSANPFIGTKNVRAPELRSYPLKRYPYRVHYEIKKEEFIVLHIRHGARSSTGWPP